MKINKITSRLWRRVIAVTVLLCSLAVFVYFQCAANIPVKDSWNKQASHIWMNWLKPCRYYRYDTDESVSETTAWIRSQLHQLEDCDKIMEIDSSQLIKSLKVISPNPTDQAIHQFLMTWSTPVIGKKYAVDTDNKSPFNVLIRTCRESTDISKKLHIKVIAYGPGNGSLVEIWDNRIYSKL